jgi:hypothetical protein
MASHRYVHSPRTRCPSSVQSAWNNQESFCLGLSVEQELYIPYTAIRQLEVVNFWRTATSQTTFLEQDRRNANTTISGCNDMSHRMQFVVTCFVAFQSAGSLVGSRKALVGKLESFFNRLCIMCFAQCLNKKQTSIVSLSGRTALSGN